MSIAARNVSWRAGGRMIVDGVSLAPQPGTTLGLLGPNGSGKSSLLRLLAGLRRVASGVVTLDGHDLGRMKPADTAARLAFVDQQAGTESPVTVQDIVRLGRTPHRGLLAGWTADDEHAVATALRQVGLEAHRLQRWDTLSGGERQRTRLACALAQCPSELLLDEPTNHLDIQHQLEILRVVTSLPTTNVIALHDLNLAAMFCDMLALLDGGRVVAAGTPEEVLTPSHIEAVFHVRASVERSAYSGKLLVQFRGV